MQKLICTVILTSSLQPKRHNHGSSQSNFVSKLRSTVHVYKLFSVQSHQSILFRDLPIQFQLVDGGVLPGRTIRVVSLPVWLFLSLFLVFFPVSSKYAPAFKIISSRKESGNTQWLHCSFCPVPQIAFRLSASSMLVLFSLVKLFP